MPNGLVVFCRRISFSFLGDDMQHFGTFMVLYLAEDTHQTLHVVSVCRTEIAEVHTGEDITFLFAKCGFYVVVAP